MNLVYDSSNRLTSVTDALGRTSGFSYDAADRMTTQTFPDGRSVSFAYDANGNVTSITPPSRPQHLFTFTPVDLEDSYAPPAVPNGGSTHYGYNRGRQLTLISRPDGKSMSFDYDSAGRLGSLAIPTGTYQYSYDTTTGNLNTITAPDNGTVTFTYDGSLLTSTAWTGTVQGSLQFTYDDDFRLATQSLGCTTPGVCDPISFGYDGDGFLISVGAINLSRDPQNGLVTGSTLGNVSDSRGFNAFGESLSYDATYNATSGPLSMLSFRYLRDDTGRITQKSEKLFSSTSTTVYTYDQVGRLATVSRDNLPVATYGYDPNGNRVSKTTSSGTEAATYDDQDRLLSYNGATYSYTANGEMASKTDATGTTTYVYDALGSLTHVSLPDARAIDYVIDSAGRRTGKKINGTLVKGWLYANGLQIVAETDRTGAVVSQFVYATRSNVPDYMMRGGLTYRVLRDHLGSPRLLVDTNTGAIAWTNGYDEFGRPAPGTPELIPFGFAGGLYDADTKLLRFGARDYDPQTGRWTTKDPIMFGGGATNFYGYVMFDPVNAKDPSGLWTTEQCRAASELLRRERRYGTRMAAVKSSNTVGDGTLSPFNNDVGNNPNFRLADGKEIDIDWFTDLNAASRDDDSDSQAKGNRAAQLILAYTYGKSIWYVSHLGESGYMLPFQDPGERTALALVIAGAKYSDVFSEQVLARECSCAR
jgi:RHS repeat-associated protein